MEVFVDYFRKDIQASSGSVDIEKDSLRYAQHKHEADEVQPGIVHYGCSAAQELFVGEDELPEVDERTEYKGRIDGFKAEFSAYEQPGQDQEQGIDYDDDRGCLNGYPEAGEHLGKHYGKTGYATDDKFAWHKEIINGCSAERHSKCHYQ